jgi:hypothetical protein
VPILNSISPTSMIFSHLPPTFVITAMGSHFVSASVAVFNGATLPTDVTRWRRLRSMTHSSCVSP